jgi:hypothetical protein
MHALFLAYVRNFESYLGLMQVALMKIFSTSTIPGAAHNRNPGMHIEEALRRTKVFVYIASATAQRLGHCA